MSRTIADLHILHSVPPNNLNRDDTGSPKTAIYGGVRRSRVSSQAWKRATRRAFDNLLDPQELGVRTKAVVELLATRIHTLDPSLGERAVELATATVTATGVKLTKAKKEDRYDEPGYLLFLSTRQLDHLAEAAVAVAGEDGKLEALLKARNVKALADTDHSIDVALFGRMVTDQTDANVDAAVQVAHAISVHEVENEYDYYTAVDDEKERAEETGAGMIGTVEFNSATLYRFASLDVNLLRENLGDDKATQRATEAFIRAFVTSMPTGKQTTFANRTLPDAVVVRLRETQPISFVGAFEKPVQEGRAEGRVHGASRRLADYAVQVEQAFDEHPIDSWVVRVGDATETIAGLGTEVSMNELVTAVGCAVADRLIQS